MGCLVEFGCFGFLLCFIVGLFVCLYFIVGWLLVIFSFCGCCLWDLFSFGLGYDV